MSETIEDLNELEPGHKPTFERVGEVLYCDGYRVEPWQLTAQELMEFFPEVYQQKYSGSIVPCPVPQCPGKVNMSDGKRSVLNHLRWKHEDLYAKAKRRFKGAVTFDDAKAIIASELSHGEK